MTRRRGSGCLPRIPEWRELLKTSVEQRDLRREEYARWMLSEVLLDPEYDETRKYES